MVYDAVVVGGGLVGATLALALADQGYKVAIVEAQSPQAALSDELDLRTVALSLASIQWLKHSGIWAKLDPQRIGTFKSMRVYDGMSDHDFKLTAASIYQSKMGAIIENKHMLYAAHAALLSHPHVTTYFNQSLEHMQSEQHLTRLTLSNETIETRLVLAADGGNSVIRRMLHIDVQQHPYHQKATVGYLRTEKPHQQTAYQRFTPKGPFALLPMSDPHLCSFVYSHPEGEPPLEDFTSLFAELGRLTLCSQTASFPLHMRLAYEYGQAGILLLGDAIHTIHPLAGQGVNLGFLDAGALYQTLTETDVSHWSSPLILKRHQRIRKWHNDMMAQSMTWIQKLYEHEGRALKWIRGLGIQGLNKSPWVQRSIVRAATGINAHVPICMQPKGGQILN